MKTYYWQCTKQDGSLIEGKFSLLHRIVLRLTGCKLKRIGEYK